MKVFWVRFSIFTILWALMILEKSEQISVSIIIFAVVLGIYFFLSLQKMSLLLYVLLSLLIFIHGYALMNDSFFPVLLLLFMTMDSAFRLKERVFSIIYNH